MDAYLGQIRLFAGNFAPNGWAICDGSSLKIADYQALYVLLANTYGGDLVTYFNLPDLRGRLPLHVGQQPAGTINYTLGQAVGAEAVTINSATLPAHTHGISATTSAATGNAPLPDSLLAKVASTAGFYEPSGASDLTTAALNGAALTAAPGGGGSHENNMPTIAVNYIICLVGLFPQFQ